MRFATSRGHGVWVPAFAGTTTERESNDSQALRLAATTPDGLSGQSHTPVISSLQVELAEIGGQAAADDDTGPQQARDRNDLDAARGDDPGGVPVARLAFEGPVEHVHHDAGDDDERELHLEHAVLEIVRGLGHP